MTSHCCVLFVDPVTGINVYKSFESKEPRRMSLNFFNQTALLLCHHPKEFYKKLQHQQSLCAAQGDLFW